MTALAQRPWLPDHSAGYVDAVATDTAAGSPTEVLAELDRLVDQNRQIHDRDCINLNPATNTMNPRAEAMLAAGLGSRASLGHPGDKYEMGLEAIEQIEVIAAELACEVFGARYAEIRVPSGAIANLYAFMASCEPGDTIIAPPTSIGGDEFVVICADLTDDQIAVDAARRIINRLTTAFCLDGHTASVSASIGIAVSDTTSTPTALLHQADLAMYRAKAGGKAQCRVFSPGADDPSAARPDADVLSPQI